MPRKRKPPTTFDAWLGLTVENAARAHGGRPFLAGLLNWHEKSVERKTRGESPFLTSELTVIAHAIPGATVGDFVTTALRGYGGGDVDAGIAATLAERAPNPETVSEAADNVTDINSSRSPRSGAQEELDEQQPRAAVIDDRLTNDQADPT